MEYFRNKVVLVTGAATGIGEASAKAFARAGAKVVVADWNVEGGEQTASAIVDSGGEAFFIQTDVRDAQQVKAMVDETVSRFGGLDCAFNNAGVFGEHKTIDELEEDVWDRMIAVNLKGPWLCMKYQAPIMIARGGGVILNNASVMGVRVRPKNAGYCSSKAGLIALTRVAAVEYGPANIRVNCVLPGAVMSPVLRQEAEADPVLLNMLKSSRPLGRIADPDVVAKAALWLCSDHAEHITGAALPIDGGFIGAA